MATAAEIQVAYKAIYRADLNATVAQAIAGTGISVDAYIAQELPKVASTTQAAVAIASFVTGTTPTSAKLDALKVEADKQVASYTALGVGNPQLGAYEAFGRSFATDPTTTAGFASKYGALSTSDFITTVYAQVYGSTPSAGAFANLTAQITYFTNLYTANNVPNAALAAKGAVLGQIVGYAFVSSASANSTLDNQVASVLTSAAKGDTSVYAKALPVVVDPGQSGVTITFANATDAVSPTAADPALKSTAFNDTINGTLTVTNKIDGAGGEDVGNFTIGGALEVAAGFLANVETVNLTSGATETKLGNATGIKTVGFANNTADGASATGIAAGVNLTLVDTTTPNSVTFGIKDASTNTADVVSLTVTGFNDATKSVTLADIETVNLTVTTADSAFKLVDTALKTFSLTASKAAAIELNSTVLETVTGSGAGNITLTGLGNAVKTIDLSASSGTNSVAAVGTEAISIKGGTGADTFGGITKSGAVVTLGAGNDSATFTLAAAASTATVTGGAGADTLALGGTGKVTVVYTAATESTTANQDSITGFDTGSDKINLAAFTLTGDKTAINTFAAVTPVTNGVDYFAGKAVAFGTFAGAADTFVLVDANNNSKFDFDGDLIVKLAGSTPVIGDFVFA